MSIGQVLLSLARLAGPATGFIYRAEQVRLPKVSVHKLFLGCDVRQAPKFKSKFGTSMHPSLWWPEFMTYIIHGRKAFCQHKMGRQYLPINKQEQEGNKKKQRNHKCRLLGIESFATTQAGPTPTDLGPVIKPFFFLEISSILSVWMCNT